MDLERLRRETVIDHTAAEGSVPLMKEGLNREDYVSCLRQIHGIVAAWEEWSTGNAPLWIQPLLAARRRGRLLERDLAWFGVFTRSEARPALPTLKNAPSVLGAMYVVEGSTLGGQLIARHVERVLKLTTGEGVAYFRGHNERTGTMWKEFCDVLRTKVPESETDTVIAAAKEMFQVFASWMQIPAK